MKKILSILLAALVAAGMTACGTEGEPSSETEQQPSSQQTAAEDVYKRQVVHRETQIPQFLLHDLSIPDHHFGAAAEEPAGSAAAHGEPGDEHLKADNGENRQDVYKRQG